jgi:hypothetical protein
MVLAVVATLPLLIAVVPGNRVFLGATLDMLSQVLRIKFWTSAEE